MFKANTEIEGKIRAASPYQNSRKRLWKFGNSLLEKGMSANMHIHVL